MQDLKVSRLRKFLLVSKNRVMVRQKGSLFSMMTTLGGKKLWCISQSFRRLTYLKASKVLFNFTTQILVPILLSTKKESNRPKNKVRTRHFQVTHVLSLGFFNFYGWRKTKRTSSTFSKSISLSSFSPQHHEKWGAN